MSLYSYFDIYHLEQLENYNLETIQSKWPSSTMVLYSKITQTPLAALIILPKENDTQFVIKEDTNRMCFQCMVNKNGAKLSMCMINLSVEGSIKFDIMRHDDLSVNKINVLGINSAYCVEIDQKTQRRMIIDELNMTIKEDEEQAKQNGIKSNGIYFILSVTPQSACPKLSKAFEEETYWKCTTGLFVRPSKLTKDDLFDFNNINFNFFSEMELGGDGDNNGDDISNIKTKQIISLDDLDKKSMLLSDSMSRPMPSSNQLKDFYEMMRQNNGHFDDEEIPNEIINETKATKLSYENAVVDEKFTQSLLTFENLTHSPHTTLCFSIWKEMPYINSTDNNVMHTGNDYTNIMHAWIKLQQESTSTNIIS